MTYPDQNIDKISAREIVLYTANHGDIHRQMTSMVLKALAKRKINGTYSHTMAVKAWTNVIEEGLRRYSKEFGKTSLNPISREYAGKQLQEEMQSDLDYITGELKAKKDSKSTHKKR